MIKTTLLGLVVLLLLSTNILFSQTISVSLVQQDTFSVQDTSYDMLNKTAYEIPEGTDSLCITARGGDGGANPGSGALVKATFLNVTPGDSLDVIVGQKGGHSQITTTVGTPPFVLTISSSKGGGGGGSAVIPHDSTTLQMYDSSIFIAAGGGGGSNDVPLGVGVNGNAGMRMMGGNGGNGNTGGTGSGATGEDGMVSGGGNGFGAGGSLTGIGYANGGFGGMVAIPARAGGSGFGGGSSGNATGGGGGGFGGGGNGTLGGGGGGGSYFATIGTRDTAYIRQAQGGEVIASTADGFVDTNGYVIILAHRSIQGSITLQSAEAGDPCSCDDPLNYTLNDVLYFHDTLTFISAAADSVSLDSINTTGLLATSGALYMDQTSFTVTQDSIFKLEFWRASGSIPSVSIFINGIATLLPSSVFEPECLQSSCEEPVTVPTLSEWGLILMLLLFLNIGIVAIRMPYHSVVIGDHADL